MKTLRVNLPTHEYNIYVGSSLLEQRGILFSHIKGKQVLIVTQQSIAELYLEALLKKLTHYTVDIYYLNEGEQYKNIEEWQRILSLLLEKNHERSTTLIALGGGVVGDITGFAAACYYRGVNYINIPTTLIAQVDSAVGGKTAINFGSHKNIIGAFYHPQCVFIDPLILKTLSDREFKAGLAEVIKYALIDDQEFFKFLEQNVEKILQRDLDILEILITKSISIKIKFVVQDERDYGLRHLLNFGHTFGHALESATHFKTFLHGEAVAMGMLMAAKLSHFIGKLKVREVERIEKLLNAYGLLGLGRNLPDFMPYMNKDKKITNGKLNLILLEEIGRAIKTSEIGEEIIRKCCGFEML